MPGNKKHIMQRFRAVAMKWEATYNRELRQIDLTVSTYSILLLLEDAEEGLSCGGIADHLDATVPDMTRLLDRLERLGYLERERSKVDRRMVRVSITKQGRAALESIRDAAEAVHRRAIALMSETDVQCFERALKLIDAELAEV